MSLTLGKLVDFIATNCNPTNGHIQVMGRARVIVVLDKHDPDNNQIEIDNIHDCWAASLKLSGVANAIVVRNIDDALLKLNDARVLFMRITSYIDDYYIENDQDFDLDYDPHERFSPTPAPTDYKISNPFLNDWLQRIKDQMGT